MNVGSIVSFRGNDDDSSIHHPSILPPCVSVRRSDSSTRPASVVVPVATRKSKYRPVILA